ncbi:MAG: type IV secretion system protein VirB10 [Janthinobacterium lividum]
MSQDPSPTPREPAAPGFVTGSDGTLYQAVSGPQAAPAGAQGVPGERHVSEVAGSGRSFSKNQAAIAMLLAAVAAVAFIEFKPQTKRADPNEASLAERLKVRMVGGYEAPPAPTVTPASFNVAGLPSAAPQAPTQASNVPSFMPVIGNKTPPDPMLKARHAGLFAYAGGGEGSGSQAGGQEGGRGAVTPGATAPNELAAKLQATPISSVTANVLRHQPYLLTEGTVIGCVLQTAMDSTLPGFVTCIIPQDVIGKTGITLLDRGTKVVGEFHGGMQQGQNRLFVLWTRAETPTGVIINLDSPAADPLGRSGFDGEVDTHFWARFGGALLLSLVQGGIQAGTAAVSPSGSSYIQTGNVQSVTSDALNSSVNIRPTLRKNQGELVSIFVARDLDFSTVYRVSTAPAELVGGGR